MNDYRRRLRGAPVHDDPASPGPAPDQLLERVAGDDRCRLGDLRRSPSVCPSLTRHRRAALRQDWTVEELAHVEACDGCRRTSDTVASAVWHPPLGMLVGQLAEVLSVEDERAVDRHLDDDGCRSCRRVLTSPWLRELAAVVRARAVRRQDVPGRVAVSSGELPRAVGEFATGTRPPFQLRAVASRGDLVVTLRETDQGQLVVHVEAPHCDEQGQRVRVELLSDGEPVVADVELRAVDGEPGCIGRHAFGPFVELVPRLRPAVALLAVLAEKSPS